MGGRGIPLHDSTPLLNTSTQALYVNEVSGRVLARYVKGKDEGDRKLRK